MKELPCKKCLIRSICITKLISIIKEGTATICLTETHNKYTIISDKKIRRTDLQYILGTNNNYICKKLHNYLFKKMFHTTSYYRTYKFIKLVNNVIRKTE